MKKLQKGFTLIELLVVIAIIGILSSVVLASLTSARTKGKDAAIQSAASNLRAQAELAYSNWGNYGSTTTAVPAGAYTHCTDTLSIFASTATGGLNNMLVGLVSTVGGTAALGAGANAKVACGSATNGTQTTWAVSASTSAGSWCVDSNGASKASPASGASMAAGLCL
jgi:prepilin-type N-terminal cleavage/methylation domain-containing protein